MIPTIVYSLCTIASTICAWALFFQFRRTSLKLLFWSGICFVGFALNNLMLVADYLSGPNIDLSIIRTIPSLIGLAVMIGAFIKETV